MISFQVTNRMNTVAFGRNTYNRAESKKTDSDNFLSLGVSRAFGAMALAGLAAIAVSKGLKKGSKIIAANDRTYYYGRISNQRVANIVMADDARKIVNEMSSVKRRTTPAVHESIQAAYDRIDYTKEPIYSREFFLKNIDKMFT